MGALRVTGSQGGRLADPPDSTKGR